MGKHIKAEWFRMMKSGNGFYCFFFISLLLCGYPFFECWDNIYKPLLANIENFSRYAVTLPFVVEIMVVALFINRYKNRTYYYEIMNGTHIHSIICSKLLTYSMYLFLVLILPNVIIYSIIAFKNGMGGKFNVGLLFICFCVIVFRAVAEAVLISMIVRRTLPVIAILYGVFIGSQTIILIIGEFFGMSNGCLEFLLDCNLYQQVTRLYQAEYSATYILAVIGSFFIETFVLYVMVIQSYRRKKFR